MARSVAETVVDTRLAKVTSRGDACLENPQVLEMPEAKASKHRAEGTTTVVTDRRQRGGDYERKEARLITPTRAKRLYNAIRLFSPWF